MRIELAPGKSVEIQYMIATSFWNADGKPIPAEEFMHNLFGAIPSFFKSEAELRELWSDPVTRKSLLEKLADTGFGRDDLKTLQQLVNAEKSDLFDVLEYISYSRPPITRVERVASTGSDVFDGLNPEQKSFVEFVLSKYIESGFDELDQSIQDAAALLGSVESIKEVFVAFQKALYGAQAA